MTQPDLISVIDAEDEFDFYDDGECLECGAGSDENCTDECGCANCFDALEEDDV